MNLLKKLMFNSRQQTNRRPKPDSNNKDRNPRVADSDRSSHHLAVSKAVGQFLFIARSYGFKLCGGSIDDLKADLETMLRFNDLTSARIELLGKDGRVLFEFKVNFSSNGKRGRIIDTGNGVELPVLDQKLVHGKRFVIQRNGLESRYQNLLKLNWSSAPTIAKSAGAEYNSEHAARISGGRQAASFHITDAARHRFVLTQVGTKGFGFCKDLDAGHDGVFVLAKHMADGLAFRVGTRFTGVLIATPKGMQVRSIRKT